MLDLGGVYPRARKLLKNFMQENQPATSYFMKNLKTLYLENCGVLDDELQLILNCFWDVEELYLSKNPFVSLPKCINECAYLETLHMNNCKRLRDIPELPSTWRTFLGNLESQNCSSLTTESLDSLYSLAKKELLNLRISTASATTFPDWFDYCCAGSTLCFRARRGNLFLHAVLAFEVVGKANTSRQHDFKVCLSINGRKIVKPDFHVFKWRYFWQRVFGGRQGHNVLSFHQPMAFTGEELNDIRKCMQLDWNEVEMQVMSESPDVSVVKCGIYVQRTEKNMENLQFKPYHASATSRKRKRIAIASPPTYEPPNKFMRTGKRKLSNTKKGSRTIKRRQTFHSRYKRNMVFPMGNKLVWRFLYH